MAHIDFPRRYFDNWNVSDTIMDEILNAMIKKDIILVSPQSPSVYPNQSQNVKITPNRS